MMRIILGITAIVLALAGCGPTPQNPATIAKDPPAAKQGGMQTVQKSDGPEITSEKINNEIVGRVVSVSDLAGVGPRDEWTFEASEFRKVDIIDRHVEENGFTITIFVTTRNNRRANEDDIQVSGTLRLHYEKNGSQWTLKKIDNLTFRYSLGVST